MAIFWFFQYGGRPPSWICDACVRTTLEGHLVVFITLQNLIGIDAVFLIIWMLFDFANLALKRLFTPPKIVLGDLTPWMERHINETSKMHILGRKDVIRRINRQNRSTGATCARDEGTKKKKERQTNKHNSGKLSIRRDHPRRSSDRNEILRGGWSSGGSSKVWISSKSVKGFRSSGVEICPFPLTWQLAYTTAYTTVQGVKTFVKIASCQRKFQGEARYKRHQKII